MAIKFSEGERRKRQARTDSKIAAE